MLALALLISTIIPYSTAAPDKPTLQPVPAADTFVISCDVINDEYVIYIGPDGRWAIAHDCLTAYGRYKVLPPVRPLPRA